MGLFNFMKKKKDKTLKELTDEQILQVVYEKGFKSPANAMLFPNGTRELVKIVTSLAKITNVTLDSSDPIKYLHLAQMYVEICSYQVISKSTNNYMMRALQEKHPDIVKDRTTARRVLVFSLLHMEDREFSLDNADDLSKFCGRESLFVEVDRIAVENDKIANQHITDFDYGLTKENPVYTDGAAGSDRYLSYLLSADGENLVWERICVHQVEGINGLVDEYQSKLPSGEVYKSVFCNLYANATSVVIPNGFRKKTNEQRHQECITELNKG